jgi:hypothetical protein
VADIGARFGMTEACFRERNQWTSGKLTIESTKSSIPTRARDRLDDTLLSGNTIMHRSPTTENCLRHSYADEHSGIRTISR